jgi:uncharacterized protein with von Willebrand factor type A (vWA) domain
MSPYEITYPGGSVEHWNEEAGAIWMDRVAQIYEHTVWLNPTAERHWDYTPSIGVMKQLVNDRMYPLTLEGLEKAMKELARRIWWRLRGFARRLVPVQPAKGFA